MEKKQFYCTLYLSSLQKTSVTDAELTAAIIMLYFGTQQYPTLFACAFGARSVDMRNF